MISTLPSRPLPTMKFLKKIPHIDVSISLYEWNQKYIVKFELDGLEQTYKISQFEIETKEEVDAAVLKADFIERVLFRFKDMQEDWDHALGMTL